MNEPGHEVAGLLCAGRVALLLLVLGEDDGELSDGLLGGHIDRHDYGSLNVGLLILNAEHG
ncbi:hypothetical protein ACF1B0_25955 [Streptomyces anandii]|uniref:hypothetical protein n=1 Tax=Streptomyces anandii TaxID=285454 RepID=UPI0036F51706